MNSMSPAGSLSVPRRITFQDEKTKQTPEIQRISGAFVFRQTLKKQQIPVGKSGEIGIVSIVSQKVCKSQV